jgi:hypothetical protein
MELERWTPMYHIVAIGLSLLIDQNLEIIFLCYLLSWVAF